MKVIWTKPASRDLNRLYRFLFQINQLAAQRIVLKLKQAPQKLTSMPRIGKKVERNTNKELRKLIVDNYKIYYEIKT